MQLHDASVVRGQARWQHGQMNAGVPPRSGTIRLVLGMKLRELRLASGIDTATLTRLKLGSAATISRIENGKVPVMPYKVVALCRAYGVDQATTDELEALAFRLSEDSILDDYGDVIPRWFSLYVQLEGLATRLRLWASDVMPGLLQTADTARAIYMATRPALEPAAIERSVAIRQTRQRAVFGRPEARICAVLGEGVMLRQVGGTKVHAFQIEHVRALNETQQVEVRVLTWASGAHAGMAGVFNLLAFETSDLPDIAYCESAAGAKYIDRPRLVPAYHEAFHSIYAQATPLEEYGS